MDFATVFRRVDAFLSGHGAPCAVIGGLALAAYGRARATFDLDLVVPAEHQQALLGFLASEGFETLHVSPGYSNHLHPDARFGRLDVVYVGAATASEVFGNCRTLEITPGLTAPVPRPEHLIAMKLLALKNDPDRTLQELADVRNLLRLEGIDRALVATYFDRHGLRDKFDELCAG